MFYLSKKEENDDLFAEDDLIGMLLFEIQDSVCFVCNSNRLSDLILKSAERLDFRANSDSIVYFCGILKNLSADSKLLKQLSSLTTMEVLSNILKSLSQFVCCLFKLYSIFKRKPIRSSIFKSIKKMKRKNLKLVMHLFK